MVVLICETVLLKHFIDQIERCKILGMYCDMGVIERKYLIFGEIEWLNQYISWRP